MEGKMKWTMKLIAESGFGDTRAAKSAGAGRDEF
jgi:hypothetical protein